MQAQKMDRGSAALAAHLGNCTKMDIRQTRKGWLQECLGCEAQTEFRYFVDGQQIAHSLEEANFCCRFCLGGNHPFRMVVKEEGTDAEILTVDRPCRCVVGCGKCCCYQSIVVSSGGQELGTVKEDCWWCVPGFTVNDYDGNPVYKIHQPTCCGGCMVNCCTEGNPCCGRGCCKVPFHIYSASDQDGDHVGKILKKPKSLMTEVYTDADAFEVDFPQDAVNYQKGIVVGTAVFLNAMFFEANDSNEAFA